MEPLRYDEYGKVILPQPDEISSQDKDHAAGSYIMMFVSQYFPLPLINLLAAFIYYMFCRNRNRFVAFHTYQSFISQIPTSLFLWGVIVWAIHILVAYPVHAWAMAFNPTFWLVCIAMIGWNILYIVYSLVAYRKAGAGKLIYLPIFGKIAFERYFGRNAIKEKTIPKEPEVNLPSEGL
jgi:uncharacterized membrane protein